jgi:tetratricopeptide (TPR) repeat protein
MNRRGEPTVWHFFRRHERRFALGYLALVGLMLVAFTLPPVRHRLLGALQSGIQGWDDRWSRRVETGELMVREGRYYEAAAYLEKLDQEFPARDVRHRRDKERERLLVALGRSHTELDRKTRAIETYQRLVAFDPKNWRNHYALAVAANKLLAGWAPAVEARDAFLQVLLIHPNHLPSVRGAMAYHAARGEFALVTPLYEQYLDAYLLQPMTLTLGDTAVSFDLPVDGRAHTITVRVNRPADWSGDLVLQTDGFSMALEGVRLESPLRVGVEAASEARDLALTDAVARGMTSVAGLGWHADSGSSSLSIPVPAQPAAIAAVTLRIRAFKPLDPTTWTYASTAYRNRLDWGGLAAVQERSFPMTDLATADSVLARQLWAYEGLGVGADDNRY